MPTSSNGVRDALLDSEERYRSLFEEAPIAYHEIDREGIVLRVNQAECNLLGFEAADLVGHRIWEFVAPGGRESSRQAVQEKVAGKRPLTVFEREYVRRDGSVRVLEIHENLIRDRQGTVVGIRSALLDITDRKKASQEMQSYAEELERKNEALTLALDSAQEATELKTRFLANVSHEIRTPLNGVLGMADLLLSTRLTREQRSFAEALRSSAESLLVVISDLLDFSKLETGRLELESAPFDPTEVLEDAAAALAPRAQEKGLELTCLVQPGMPRLLRGDRGRLRQVMMHLLSNALKFTERGEVAVRGEVLRQTEERAVVQVTVTDTGIGIAPEMQGRIFQSFVQADASSTRRYGGVGLGLAITKQVVEMMGGQIELQSELGQGSVFRLTLPFATCGGLRDPSAALGEVRVLIVDDNATNRSILREYLGSWGCRTAEAASARQALVLLQEAARHGQPFRVALVDMQMPEADGAMLARWIRADAQLRDLLLISLTSAPVAGEAARLHEIGYAEYLQKPIRQSHLYDILVAALRPRPAPESARRILLAEDNEVNRTIALRILACAGYDADSVSDGRQAVEAVCHGGYDLVLMDIQMPEMDGFEATAEIRRRLAPSACPPIVAMTANALEGDRDRCLLAGMNDYIAKPIRLEELRTTVERWIGPPAARGERLDTSSRPQA